MYKTLAISFAIFKNPTKKKKISQTGVLLDVSFSLLTEKWLKMTVKLFRILFYFIGRFYHLYNKCLI